MLDDELFNLDDDDGMEGINDIFDTWDGMYKKNVHNKLN